MKVARAQALLAFAFVSSTIYLVADVVTKERAEDFQAACAKHQGVVEIVGNVKLCLRKESP